MRRPYRLDAQPDLFGGSAVMKDWGRCSARPIANADAGMFESGGDEIKVGR